MDGSSSRRGFSMMEIMVALAILAVLSATLIPTIMVKVQDARRAALSQTLLAISQGVAEYRKAVTRYPPTLVELTKQPVGGVTTDACGTATISAISAANWRGPYLSREMLSTGLQMADGTIQNALRRVTAASSTSLLIDVAQVERRVATDMEAEFDGSPADSTGGTIRYTSGALPSPSTVPAAPAGTVNLSYSIPISGC